MKSRGSAKAPGKNSRLGLTVMQLLEIFPDDETAEKYLKASIWDPNRCCGFCGAVDTVETKSGRPMKYRCRTCGKHFNIRAGTLLHDSNVPLRKWVFAIYLIVTNLKGISSMKIHRELDVTQKTAWYMMQRIRESMSVFPQSEFTFTGEVEVDETYIGGKEGNRHTSKKLRLGRGAVGKKTVIGARDRESGFVKAKVIDDTNRETLHGFIKENVSIRSQIYTDEVHAYKSLVDYQHKSVKHSAGEFVKDKASTNGIESFWAMLKRGYLGTYHNMSFKHLHRYIAEFVGRHNIRHVDTFVQILFIMRCMAGTHLPYKKLINKE